MRTEPLTPHVPLRTALDVVALEEAWGKILALAIDLDRLEHSTSDVGAKVGIQRATDHLHEACASMRLALSKARR